jgi:16S rRNA G527 N7-methylase RsmG
MAEAKRRRVSFLKEVIRLLALKQTKVFHCRIGIDFTVDGPYEAIVARAVAAPTQWIPWAMDLLMEDGILLLMLGPSVDLEELGRKLKDWRLRVQRDVSVRLPGTGRRRRIMVVEKIGCFT